MTGVPVILHDDMTIAEGPQHWLFYIALDRGRTRSRATWRSYAEALYEQTCQMNGWEWDQLEEGHLRAYRNQMLYHPSSYRRADTRRPTTTMRLLFLYGPPGVGKLTIAHERPM